MLDMLFIVRMVLHLAISATVCRAIVVNRRQGGLGRHLLKQIRPHKVTRRNAELLRPVIDPVKQRVIDSERETMVFVFGVSSCHFRHPFRFIGACFYRPFFDFE